MLDQETTPPPAPADERPQMDPNDPLVIARKLQDAANGLEQQAKASKTGTAMAGHPYPDYFFRDTAEWCRRGAAQLIASAPKPVPVQVPADVPTPTPSGKTEPDQAKPVDKNKR